MRGGTKPGEGAESKEQRETSEARSTEKQTVYNISMGG